jgi:hypothetical protein
MTRQETNAAFAIADNQEISLYPDVDTSIFDGFGLRDFQPVYVTLRQVAALMRWQALQFNGEWNAEALNDVVKVGRTRFLILSGETVQA